MNVRTVLSGGRRLVVSALALLLFPTALFAQAPRPEIPEVVARVNGDPIHRVELFAQAQMMRYQAVRAGQKDPGEVQGFYHVVLDALVNEHLLYLELEDAGKLVSDERVEQEVQSMMASYDSPQVFEETLAKQGISQESLRHQLKKNLSIEQYLARDVSAGIEIPESALREVYEKNKENLRVPESRKVSHILMRIPVTGGPEAREEVKTRLLGLRQQVQEGADFAALAREYSEDGRTRERGGALPWIAITGKGNVFEQTVSDLENLGDVSDVIETELGLHILQLTDREPARYRTFEEVRGELEGRLRSGEMRRQIQNRVMELREAAKVELLL
jgi:peptidyl-prolyl cis-trans isomerase C